MVHRSVDAARATRSKQRAILQPRLGRNWYQEELGDFDLGNHQD
jgi:hypothetical protein